MADSFLLWPVGRVSGEVGALSAKKRSAREPGRSPTFGPERVLGCGIQEEELILPSASLWIRHRSLFRLMRFFPTLIASIIGTLLGFAVLFLIGLALLIGFSATADQSPSVQPNTVLDVRISGPVPERTSDDPLVRLIQQDRVLDLRNFRSSLDVAAADDRISMIWFQPRGVGASWATLQEMRTELVDFKESGKEIVAFAGPNGFSEKDYFLASAADEIYAPPASDFELNGFALSVSFYSDLLDRLDVDAQAFRAGQYKSAVEPFTRTDMSEPNRRQFRALVEDQSSTFFSTVAEARGLSADDLVTRSRENPVYSARQARDAGLIDSLLYESEVRTLIKARTDQPEDDDLTTIEVGRYSHVPASSVGRAPTGNAEIAVVYAEGTIVAGESRDSPGAPTGPSTLGSETFEEAVDEALDDENVRGIVIRIDSPGGSATASDAMWHVVRRAAEEKPVIVSMGSTAASGGYYISAPADSIVADPLTVTGSIGVFGVLVDASGLFENHLGVTFDDVQTSPYADMFSGLRPLRPAEEERVQAYVDTTYATFLRRVADGRDMAVSEIDSVARGRIWTGRQALEQGLVDVLGNLDDAVTLAAERSGLDEGSYSVTVLPRPEPIAERLSRAFQVRAADLWFDWTAEPTDRRLRRHLEALRSLEQMHARAQARMPYRVRID